MISLRPLVAALLSITLFFSGCTGLDSTVSSITALPNPTPPDPQTLPGCGASLTPPVYKNQFLLAGDIQQSNNLWIYQLDAQTGVPTLLPFSPIATVNGTDAAAVDATGKSLYLATEAPIFAQPPETLETYTFDGKSAPVRLDVQSSGFASVIYFDPQGKYLYFLDGSGIFFGPKDGKESALQPYTIDPSGKPVLGGAPGLSNDVGANSFGFKPDGNWIVVARGDGKQDAQGRITVFREQCSSGGLTNVSEFSWTDGLRFMAVPRTGAALIGYDCIGSRANNYLREGAQMFLFDNKTGTVSAVPNGFYPGVCRAFVDREDQYVAAEVFRDPTNKFGPEDLVIYRLDKNLGTLTEVDRVVLPPLAHGVSDRIVTVAFDASDFYLYVPLISSLAAFKIDRATGKLTPLPGSPYDTNIVAYYPLIAFGQN